MNNDKDYASDSDSSDEDFRPDENEEKPVSEDSSDDDIDDEELEKDVEKQKSKRGKRKGKTTIQTKAKATNKAVESKRTTRHSTEAYSDAARKDSCQEKEEIESDDEEKARADALWADFLGDVKQSTSNDVKKPEEKSKATKVTTTNGDAKIVKIEDKGVKASNGLDDPPAPKEVTITEVLDFAGEEIRVQKTVSADSVKENKTVKNLNNSGSSVVGLKRAAATSSSSSGGLGSLLNQIGKKKKISVLEKTKLDWNTFKKDEGIEEELQTFNKGKDGFLERQDFLERTDLRQFEIERNLRQTRRKN